jgi:hypothetical protein
VINLNSGPHYVFVGKREINIRTGGTRTMIRAVCLISAHPLRHLAKRTTRFSLGCFEQSAHRRLTDTLEFALPTMGSLAA